MLKARTLAAKLMGGEQLGSYAAGTVKYAALCEQWEVNSRGDVLSASWNRWP